jgi:hypothetical protein
MRLADSVFIRLMVFLWILTGFLFCIGSGEKRGDGNMDSVSFVYAEENVSNTKSSDLVNYSNETAQFDSPSNRVLGTILVIAKVLNNEGGSNEPSDFTVKVHGNNASPSSFTGNATGTIVKVDMGMYSVLESELSNYSTSYSEDCSGAVMSTTTKVCTITNLYQKPLR